MRLHNRHARERTVAFDLAPMIDVVFLLIIFFLTTAQFARMTRADVELPVQPGEQDQRQDEPGVVINIVRDGRIIVDDETVGLAGLERILRNEIAQSDGQSERVKTMLRVDRSLPASKANEVVRLLQDLGVRVGRFATEIPR